jgi:hypothetical protein
MKKYLALTVLILAAASLVFAAYPYEYPLYLGMLGFSKDEIHDLQGGRLHTHSIKNKAPGEIGIVAAKVSNVPVYYFRDYYEYIENYKTLLSFQQVGKFKTKPNLQDLKPLILSKEELQDYVSCTVGDCRLKLSTEEIKAIPKTVDLNTDADRERVSDSYRQVLLKRLVDYQKGGMDALSGYQDSPEDSTPAAILNGHLLKFQDMLAYFPITTRYLREYPRYKNKLIEEFFFWSKDSQGNKPVLSLRHVFSQKVGEDYLVVNKLIYSDHYLLSSISVMHLINYADQGGPRTLMVLEQRSLTDLKGDPFAGFGRNILRVNMEKRMVAGLKNVGQTMEDRYRNHVYDGFPFGLIPRDQR